MWMPSLDLAGGLWARARRTLYTFFSRLSRYAQRFWLSRAYFPVLLTVAGAFMAAGQPVYGVVALGCIVIWLLAACPDLLAPVCPFFMAFLMSTQCYGQLSDFLPCAALVPPLVLALLWHFAVWPVTLRLGRSGMGLALVSIATLLGGCDVITRKQAVEPLSLYYTLGLGVGMLVLYVLFYHRLFAITFDESFSRATGVRVELYNTVLSVLTALTIVLGMRLMGAMLISSLVIFPALTAMRLLRSFRGVVLCAAAVSVLGFCVGLTGSYLLSTPVGATVVLVDLAVFLLACLLGRLKIHA